MESELKTRLASYQNIPISDLRLVYAEFAREMYGAPLGRLQEIKDLREKVARMTIPQAFELAIMVDGTKIFEEARKNEDINDHPAGTLAYKLSDIISLIDIRKTPKDTITCLLWIAAENLTSENILFCSQENVNYHHTLGLCFGDLYAWIRMTESGGEDEIVDFVRNYQLATRTLSENTSDPFTEGFNEMLNWYHAGNSPSPMYGITITFE